MMRFSRTPPSSRSVSRDMRRSCTFLTRTDRKSTRLNSSHGYISYAVFCLKKKRVAPVTFQLKQSRRFSLAQLFKSLFARFPVLAASRAQHGFQFRLKVNLAAIFSACLRAREKLRQGFQNWRM